MVVISSLPLCTCFCHGKIVVIHLYLRNYSDTTNKSIKVIIAATIRIVVQSDWIDSSSIPRVRII